MEEIKENKNVIYYFAIFTIINKLLIIKNDRISPAYYPMSNASAQQDAVAQ